MEPLSALSLACNILDLIERGYKGAKIVKEIYNAPDGQQAQHGQLEHILDDVKEIWEQLEHDNNQGSILHNGVHFQEVAQKRHEASNAMRVILDECKSKKPGSLHHAAAAFVRSLAKGRQIEQQLLILGQCREALKLHIISSTHHEVGELLKSLKRVDIGQQKIQNIVQTLLDDLHGDDGKSLSSQLGKIKEISDQAVARFNANRIIQSLDVSHTRFDEVTDASPYTYRWIYDDRPGVIKACTPRLSDEAVQARIDLQTWLHSGSGVLHIAGKPGSGKSTLMKFLVKSDGTEQLLKKWAPSQKLIVLKFFFWKPGSPSQNTLRGLKRSVVAQILNSVPELSQDLFPEIHRAEFGLILFEKPLVDSSDVQLAFERLLGSQSIQKLRRYKICLFLDGLDEFNESIERINHANLVRQIMDWVDTSNGHVKAVVSSRQLPAFESILAVYRIRLQEVTKKDITDYVKGTLDINSNFNKLQCQDPPGCQLMIQELATRAEGVFLWVSLVVQSIQDGSENLDPLTKLRTRIGKTPQELGELFDQILSKIDQGPYLKEVYLLLAIASTETWAGQPPREVAPVGKENEFPFISLLAAGCLFDEMDSGLSLQSMLRDATRGYASKKYDASAFITSATRISGRCLGLLEIAEHDDGRFSSQCVKFLHKSIPEHLGNHLSKRLHKLHIDKVDILNTMAWMIAIELRYSSTDHEKSSFKSHVRTYISPNWEHIMSHVGYLIHWITVASSHSQMDPEDTTFQLLSSIDRAILGNQLLTRPESLVDESSWAFASRCSTALTNACYFGLGKYVEWTLARGLERYSTKAMSALLVYSTCAGYLRQFDCLSIFPILFESGISADCSISSRATQIMLFDSIWILLIGISLPTLILFPQIRVVDVPPPPSEIWSIIETFLTHGARPTWYLIWKPVEDRTQRNRLREMLEVDPGMHAHGGFTGPSIEEFSIHSETTGEEVFREEGDWPDRLKLASSNQYLLRSLLDEYESTPSSEKGFRITIRFEDLLKHLSPKNGEYMSSLLRQQRPEEQNPSENGRERKTATVYGQMRTRDGAKVQWWPSTILILCLIAIFGSLSFGAT